MRFAARCSPALALALVMPSRSVQTELPISVTRLTSVIAQSWDTPRLLALVQLALAF